VILVKKDVISIKKLHLPKKKRERDELLEQKDISQPRGKIYPVQPISDKKPAPTPIVTSIESIICIKCGANNRSIDHFCKKCGEILGEQLIAGSASVTTPAVKTSQKASVSDKKPAPVPKVGPKELVKCIKCGAGNSPKSKFCKNCGEILGEQLIAGSTSVTTPAVKTSQKASVSDKKPAPVPKVTHKKAPKKARKKAKSSEEKETVPTQKEIEELKKTESEVDIEEKAITCIVHKGPIDGAVYICPKCKTFYCSRCANALKDKGEKCWSCKTDINVFVEDSVVPEDQRKIRKYELNLNTLRKTVQNLDDSFFNGAITKEEYSDMREPLMNKITTIMEKIEKLED
jgi:hypothetical protein